MTSIARPSSAPQPFESTICGGIVGPALCFAAIGVELMVLVAWLPDTLGVWFRPDKNGYGDFLVFYRNASGFYLNGFYSPGLAVLMHPLTYLSMRPAFGVYFGINVAALAGVAYLAQRSVESAAGEGRRRAGRVRAAADALGAARRALHGDSRVRGAGRTAAERPQARSPPASASPCWR